MAGKYAIELLFNEEVGLSDGEISEEEGEDAYCYSRESCWTKEYVDNLGRQVG